MNYCINCEQKVKPQKFRLLKKTSKILGFFTLLFFTLIMGVALGSPITNEESIIESPFIEKSIQVINEPNTDNVIEEGISLEDAIAQADKEVRKENEMRLQEHTEFRENIRFSSEKGWSIDFVPLNIDELNLSVDQKYLIKSMADTCVFNYLLTGESPQYEKACKNTIINKIGELSS